MRARIRAAGGGGCKGAADCPRPAARQQGPGNQAMLRRLAGGRGPQRRMAPPVVHDVLRGGGRALDAGTRGFFEQGLGADLSAVRVHDNALAAQSARAVDAAAYAVGPHVVFDTGRLAPSRPEGLQLLAHELAHVVQSGPSLADTPDRIRIGEPDAPEEQEARGAAKRLSGAESGGVQAGGAEQALRRQSPDEEAKPAPKPVFPLPVFDKFDPVPFVPTPGGTAPSPYDQPGKVTDPSGKGPSLEDLRGAREKLFGKSPLNLGINSKPQMPGCSTLETPDSTKAQPKYWTHEQYDVQRRLYHGPLTKDCWPQLSPEQYKAFIDNCPKAVKQEMPVIPPAPPSPKGDFPRSTLPPGQAMA